MLSNDLNSAWNCPHPLDRIRAALAGTRFEGNVYLVGGAVRDELLFGKASDDFDLVTTDSAVDLAMLLEAQGLADHHPVVYPRFGTAMVVVSGHLIEVITARKESYDPGSRKPSVVAASYLEDAQRRDFTLNALARNIFSGELFDPLETGLEDLKAGLLRTPVDPARTFSDDPLRMFRAIRFKHRFGFAFAPDIIPAIEKSRSRLLQTGAQNIVSIERLRDEFLKILAHPSAPEAVKEMMELRLLDAIVPEFGLLIGVEQGSYHFLDVWDHSLLVLKNLWKSDVPSVRLSLSALFHDIEKPSTKRVLETGKVTFYSHENLGAETTARVLSRWRLPQKECVYVAKLVRNHMRLASAETFTSSAARRLWRDLGEGLEDLLKLVEADAGALAPGVRKLSLAKVRERLVEVQESQTIEGIKSPLSGKEIMDLLGIEGGPEVGKAKEMLLEMVIEGHLPPDGVEEAKRIMLLHRKVINPEE